LLCRELFQRGVVLCVAKRGQIANGQVTVFLLE
jgi:hypothetical protein